MINKAGPARDPFAFSLGGMTTIASVVAPAIVADDRFNKVREARADQSGQWDSELLDLSESQIAHCCA